MKAILAGTVETGLGTTLSNVTIFLEKGKITDIVEGHAPGDAEEVIDASKLVVTPGFIDAHTHIGTYCEGFPSEMGDANDMVNPIASQLRILDAVYQDDTAFGDALALVDPPRLVGPDTPDQRDLPAFSARLADAIEATLRAPFDPPDTHQLAPFTWQAVFSRVEAAWQAAFTCMCSMPDNLKM